VRLFFALWPPRDTARALGAWARGVQARSGGKVIPQESIHLTLVFLGEADPEKAAAAARRVRGARCELPLELPEYRKRQRIVWVGPGAIPAALAALARDLRNELLAEGCALEARGFQAHVTLLRKARDPGTLPALPALGWAVDEFVLMRSTLSSGGSIYETLERFALTPGS
jgi:2'-5' RNA ligase